MSELLKSITAMKYQVQTAGMRTVEGPREWTEDRLHLEALRAEARRRIKDIDENLLITVFLSDAEIKDLRAERFALLRALSE